MRQGVRTVTIALGVLAGCYESVTPGGDVGPADGGPCEPVGGFARCTGECGGHHACTAGFTCNTVVCVPFLGQCDGSSAPTASSGAAGRYCAAGDAACVQDPRFGPPLGGDCVPDTVCDELSTVGLQCYWFDVSEYDGSPAPTTTCPPTEGSTPLCGGACGDCLAEGRMPRDLHCIGRNGERDLGVCSLFSGACTPEMPASSRETVPGYAWYDGWPASGTVCLVFRDAAGVLLDFGYPVPDTGCRTYRSLFPAAVECMGDGWTPLP